MKHLKQFENRKIQSPLGALVNDKGIYYYNSHSRINDDFYTKEAYIMNGDNTGGVVVEYKVDKLSEKCTPIRTRSFEKTDNGIRYTQ